MGLTAVARPIPVPRPGLADLVAMVASAAIFLALSARRRELSRLEGSVFLASYLGYMVWRAG